MLLEAWNHAVPALVNGRCKVLAGQVTRANGGLYYMFPAEFDEAADYLLTQRAERDALGRQGLAYVDREYRWPTVIARVESLLEQVQRRHVRPRSVDVNPSRAAQASVMSAERRQTVPRSIDTRGSRSAWSQSAGPAITYTYSSHACSRSVGDGTGALCGWEWYDPTILSRVRLPVRHRGIA